MSFLFHEFIGAHVKQNLRISLTCVGNINGDMVDHRNGGWDGGRGYGVRGRGRGRGRGLRGRGRGYGGGNMQWDSGYYNGNDPSGPLPGQGRGKSLLPMFSFAFADLFYCLNF